MTWAYRLEGPMRFVRHDVPKPAADDLGDGDVLLRYLAGGVCGSDLVRCRDGASTTGAQPFGWSLHEIVGEVVESKSDLPVGARVVGWVSNTSGLCEYVATRANQVLEVPGTLDDIHAVPLQPLACVLWGRARLGDISGMRAAVIGLGPVGLLFAHALADGGAAVVGVDPVDRTDVAAAFGCDEVVNRTSRTWARSVAGAAEFDLIVEAVGHQVGTIDDAIGVAAMGAKILYFGNPDDEYYPVRFGRMMDRNLTLLAGRTPPGERRAALELAQAYVARHPRLLQTYVTHVLPVAEAQAAYDLASRPSPGRLKVVVADTDRGA